MATERAFITREQSAERMLQIVRFLAKADRFHGVWPHFLNGDSGRVNAYFGTYDDGGDLVETAFLVQGLLAARQYYDGDNAVEREIRDTITAAGLEPIGLHWLLAKTEGFHATTRDAEMRKRTAAYVCDLARLSAELGGKVLVFGSPQQRSLQEGVTLAEAHDHFV